MKFDFNLDLASYTYQLPEDRIAIHGLKQRDHSKLLLYKNNKISDRIFNQITDLIPENSTLFLNNTKVIQARLKFLRASGAVIEVFLLSPVKPIEMSLSLASVVDVQWQCMIGNLKKWKTAEVLTLELQHNDQIFSLEARLIDRTSKIVAFSWPPSMNIAFATIIDMVGSTPLPPYIKRKVEAEDKQRYQTVYSELSGAVAAPTAGLHFTPNIIKILEQKGVKTEYLTLHVGAGTFQPIQTTEVADHPMHNEKIYVTADHIKTLLESDFVISVGTTSMRTLESLFWYGQLLQNDSNAPFNVNKLSPYEHHEPLLTKEQALLNVLEYMDKKQIKVLKGETEIFIFPGYSFKICDGLITNFHQPGSTLILLVAAFIGDDWKKIYQHALANDYRFLSYGDSSILLP